MTRSFRLLRHEDVSGKSGIGYVGRGFEFDDGWVAFHWRSGLTPPHCYPSMAVFEEVHCHGGKSVIEWDLCVYVEAKP